MGETKIAILVLNFIGIPVYVYTLFVNLGNIQGFILSAIAIVYGCARVYFYIRRQANILVKESQDRELKELDIKEKHLDSKERELELLELELSLRVTGKTPEQRKNKL